MKFIQHIAQTNNEQILQRVVMLIGFLVGVLFFVYISQMYQVTQVAYEIKEQQRQHSEYLEKIAILENDYHQAKLELTTKSAYELGFAKMSSPQYVSVETKRYTLAR